MKSYQHQAGATLVEVLIGLALSLVVTSSMVALMGNSLGSASRIIQMTQLSDEMRNTMSMITRDLRRANYSANSAYCYGNSDCGLSGGIAAQAGDITVDNNDCLTFNLDRDQDGDASEDGAGGFRLAADGGGNGYIEMWVGGASPDCDANFGVANDDWIDLSDPDFVNITTFNIDSSGTFWNDLIEDGGGTLRQTTREVVIQIEGSLVLEPNITRRIEDTIRVRNDFLFDPNS